MSTPVQLAARAETLLGQLRDTLQQLAAAVAPELAVDAVECPACRQRIVPNADGTLPAHEISAGPKRSPYCRFRGRVDAAAPCVDTSCDTSTDRSTDSSDVMAAVERAASADLLGDLYAEDLVGEVPDGAEQYVLAVQQPGGGAS